MVLLIDTREQAPLTFTTIKGVEVRVQMLPTGDYGAEHDEGVWLWVWLVNG